ncbi:hypothetical protein DY000_02006289 [Brassica cretica]|uniref:Aspartic peptidase DDI1-type domain-containing protein n=1 Tax=Brassica cretica TaxID=69181 RepID=A0ABQ7C1S2_BRACR|nr:hypothetical protein DY000_02006289 [Brassica cretica]
MVEEVGIWKQRIDRQQHCCINRREQPSTDHPSTAYQVRLPDLDAHPLNATRNPSQTLVFLETTEKISQQSAEAPEQEQSTLAETSLVEIDQRQWDGYEHLMEKQETKEGVQSEKRVTSRKVFIPKYLRREVNKVELDGFHKRVKRVPKDMSFEDAYYKTLKKEQDPGKFLIPCCIRDTGSAVSIMAIDSADLLGLKMEPSQDSFTFVDNSKANSAGMIKNVKVEIGDCSIPVDFHVVKSKSGQISSLLFGRAFMATVGEVCDLKKNRMCLTNVDETVFYDPVEKKKGEKFIACIEMFEDPGPTADFIREPAIPESALVDIRVAESVDFQSSESIGNKPSESDDSQSSESIDTKLSASVDTLRLSEQPETEKSKSGGRNKNRKKKKKRNADADSQSVVPLQCQESSLEYRVRCKGGSESFTKVRVLCDPELRDRGEASARAFINCINKMRLKMEPSQDSFTFVDNSKANSAGMIKNVKLFSIASPQYQNQCRSTLDLQHQSTSSPKNRSTISLQNRTTLSLQNRSTRSFQHRSIPSDFQNNPRPKSLNLGEGTGIERRKRKGMKMQIPYQ